MIVPDEIAKRVLKALANGALSPLSLTEEQAHSATLVHDGILAAEGVWEGRPVHLALFLMEPDQEILEHIDQREQALSGVSHEGVVEVLALRVVEGRVVMVAEGTRLETAKGLNPSSTEDDWKQLARQGAEVAEALAALHEGGVLHRALNPSAVGFAQHGVQLRDFGLAQPPRAPSFWRPDLDPPAFPAFASPEQSRGEAGGIETDVYSLGALLFYWVTGKPPHGEGVRDWVLERIRTQASPRLLTQTPAELGAPPEAFARIVDTALAYRSGVRYPSMTVMAQDLRSFAEGGEVVAKGPQGGLVEHFQTRQKTWVAVGGFLLACAILYFLTRDGALKKPAFPELIEERIGVAWLCGDESGIGSGLSELEEQFGATDQVVSALRYHAKESALSHGAWLTQQDKWGEAIPWLLTAVKEHQGRELPKILLAGAAFKSEQPQVQTYRSSIEGEEGGRRAPATKSSTVLAIRCWAQWREGDEALAMKNLEPLQAKAGITPWPAFVKALSLVRAGASSEELRKATQPLDWRKPSHADRLLALINDSTGIAPEVSLDLLDRGAQQRPYDLRLRNRLARLLIRQQQVERALSVLRETLQLRPKDQEALQLIRSLKVESPR